MATSLTRSEMATPLTSVETESAVNNHPKVTPIYQLKFPPLG